MMGPSEHDFWFGRRMFGQREFSKEKGRKRQMKKRKTSQLLPGHSERTLQTSLDQEFNGGSVNFVWPPL